MKALTNIKTLLARQQSASRDAFAAIAEIRERRLALVAEREHVAAAPMPPADAAPAIEAWLDETAAAFDVSFRSMLHPDWKASPGLSFPRQHGGVGLDAAPAVRQLLGLVVLTNRDAVRDMVARSLEDAAEGKETISNADRARRLAAIDAEVTAVERVEETLIREAETAGLPVLRREDARPEVVLLSHAALAT